MPDDEKPPGNPDPPESSKTVKGKKTEREIALELKLSELEDAARTKEARLGELEAFVSSSRKVPSARKPGKSVFDEIHEFIFGED
jgi:hypothetical protein